MKVNEGFEPSTPEEVLKQITNELLKLYPNISYMPGTIIEMFLSAAVLSQVETEKKIVDILNSMSPKFNQNHFLLQNFADAVGLVKQGVRASSVEVLFENSGLTSLYYPKGIKLINSVTQVIYYSDSSILIPQGGSLLVTCETDTPSSDRVDINKIIGDGTLPSTLQVSNPSAGMEGSNNPETTQELQKRVREAFLVGTQPTVSRLKHNLSLIPNVNLKMVSITSQTDRYTIVVGGGDIYEIAKVLYDTFINYPLMSHQGVPIAQQVTVPFTDGADNCVIKFVRPELLKLKLTYKWKANTIFISESEINFFLTQYIFEYIESLIIGSNFIMEQVISYATTKIVSEAILIDSEITYTINGGIDRTDDLVVSPFQYLQIDSGDITVMRGV